MDKFKKYFSSFIDSSYQQMNDKEKNEFEKKMDAEGQGYFNKLKKTLELMNYYQVPDPGNGYWDNLWNRIEERLDKIEKNKNTTGIWPVVLRVAAILLTGIFIGYLIFSAPEPSKNIADVEKTDVQLTALNKKVADVLEESQILLLGIVNIDIPNENSQTIDFSFQIKISNDLLLRTSDLKKQLSKIRNRRMVRLIDDLELILRQIANLDDDFNLPVIKMVRQGAENQSLLYKINMERLLMQAEEDHQLEVKGKTKKEL